jgi:hypothetical protein
MLEASERKGFLEFTENGMEAAGRVEIIIDHLLDAAENAVDRGFTGDHGRASD